MGVEKQQDKRQIEIDLVGKWAPAGPVGPWGFRGGMLETLQVGVRAGRGGWGMDTKRPAWWLRIGH